MVRRRPRAASDPQSLGRVVLWTRKDLLSAGCRRDAESSAPESGRHAIPFGPSESHVLVQVAVGHLGSVGPQPTAEPGEERLDDVDQAGLGLGGETDTIQGIVHPAADTALRVVPRREAGHQQLVQPLL